jgi:hypothetical protein
MGEFGRFQALGIGTAVIALTHLPFRPKTPVQTRIGAYILMTTADGTAEEKVPIRARHGSPGTPLREI